MEKFLTSIGISDVKSIVHNPTYDQLYEDELKPDLEGFARGQLTELGAVNVLTGEYTGRSPKDKFIVMDDTTRDSYWWNGNGTKNDNKPIDIDVWNELKALAGNQLSRKKLYIVDGFCGANKDTCMSVRFVMEVAWQAHFVKNMFIRPNEEELANFIPDFTVVNASTAINPDWERHGMNSPTFVAFNLTERMQLIGGTWYGGEMKKGLFSVMNYLLPQKGIASMHCSANCGAGGDVALFFGLSGTGKTTLSASSSRSLIGDDEHGWDDDGVFNFEGGCYAKTSDLSAESEPEIYQAIRRDALLENVMVDDAGKVDFKDTSLTLNTRVSYPIHHIDNIVEPVSKAGHAKNILFLTADAFGVLPAISILDEAATQYHFLSGFTAKMAGMERGMTEHQPTFSACFGAAFLTLHPTVYAKVLNARMNQAGAKAYLINTGWNGQGKRISLVNTRRLINAIFDDELDDAETEILPIFKLKVPKALAGFDGSVLDPRSSYDDPAEWEKRARYLGGLFIENFKKFTDTDIGKNLVSAGPQLG